MSENMMLPKPQEILDIIRETDMEYTFKLKSDIKAKYGQFFEISIPKVGEAPISVSSIGDDWLEFTVRRVGTLTNELFNLKVGDNIFIRGPYGNGFPMDEYKDKHLIIIAGGTGVSPVRGLLQYYYENYNTIKSLYFIAGFKDKDSILFKRDLNTFKTKFQTIYTLDNERMHGFETGLVTEYIKKIPFDDFEDYNVIIVGPPMMMHFASLECLKNGVSENKIWLSFERKMSCGIGKCGHCKINETYVCLEGPIFNYTKAKNLHD